ncbi:Nuclear receptor corepressor 1 [Toxocara canis]|uniref:Nuclear receptor corepressor 1 n=1 Tax=Toxocara canis TaxID=6265 RepID=A0A0B2V667_TOXCA|nr:Nuclear receptor corepressor 1 [Toxocara canis]
MFPGNNSQFPPNGGQQAANNMSNMAALYLHPSLGLSTQAYSQLYQQGQAQLAQQQLQRQVEQLIAAQAHNAQIQAFQRSNAFRQPSHLHVAHPPKPPPTQSSVARARQHAESSAEVDARRRRSLISDFAAAPAPPVFAGILIPLLFSLAPVRSTTMVGDVVAEAQRVNTMRELVSPTTDESTEKKKNSITDRLEIVEKEKKHLDAQLTIIQRKKEHHDCELAKLAKLGEDKSSEKESEECADESSMSLVERIYAENRRKAAEAHAATKNAPALPPLFADTVPLYQNPADCPLVQETIERYQIVKPLLVKMLIDKKQKESLAQKYQTEKYNVMYAEWLAKDERYCKSQKKMARDEKHREIFERTFPELKKAREERERNGRSNGGNGGTSKKSDAEQDEEEKRRAAAALPPMMLSARDRRGVFYIDLNGVVRNPLEEHNNFVENFLSTWSEDEKLVRTLLNTMFKEQIVAYGKNFAAIAEFLDRKTVKDCVLYYYLSKKRQNYKALMGKRRRKPAKYYKPPVMPKAEEVLMRAPQDAGAVPLNGPKEYECCVCNCKIDNETNPGRVLTRASYEAHGVDANQANPSDVRICQKCRMKAMKAKNATRCQVGTCHNARRKVKPTRPMPPKWKLMNVEQKEFFMHHMLIPDGIMKCCPACHKKITKKLDMLFNGELEAEMKLWQESATVIWTEEEIEVLRLTVEAVGIDDWETVAEKMDADNHKFSAEQCRQQFEKLGAADKAKQSNMESEEEEGSDEENEAQQTAPLTTLKEEHPEAEHDPSGESSATLSADEVANHDECTVLSPAVSTQQSSATQIYKPRFRGVAHSASESASFDVPDSNDISSIIKREVERASETSPAVHMQAHDVLVRSSSSDTAPKSSSTSALPTAICKPSAFTSAATVPSPHSTTQGLGGLPQCAFTMPSAMRQAAAPSLSVSSNQSISTVSSTRGSITQGTPMMRPPSVPGYEPLLDKLKQQTQVLSAGAAAAASVTPGSAVGASTTPLGQAATAATPLGIQVAAVAPFATGAQPPPVGTPFAAPGTPAPPDSRMSPIAAFYSQFATLDPALQDKAAAASVTPGSAVGASTTPLGQAATAATPLGIQVAAVAPFATGAQPPPVGTPFAAPGTPAPPDSRMSPIAAFYSQFATLDPALQYAMTLKLMQAQQQQQEFERARLAVFQSRGIGPGGATGASLMDAYRQQALAMGLSEQQAQSCQQHLSALTGIGPGGATGASLMDAYRQQALAMGLSEQQAQSCQQHLSALTGIGPGGATGASLMDAYRQQALAMGLSEQQAQSCQQHLSALTGIGPGGATGASLMDAYRQQALAMGLSEQQAQSCQQHLSALTGIGPGGATGASLMDAYRQQALAMGLSEQQAQSCQQHLSALTGIGPGGATGASLMDAYRQQALAMGLSEQQAQSCQQHLSALTGDPKFLLWQQLLQQQQAAALKQQQQAAAASSSGLAQAATASMLSNVQATAAAGHLPGQQSVEQQHQTALAQLVSMSSAVAAAAADPQQQQQQQRQLSAASAALSAANSQLFNDFRNAEQMRKERDEGVKQLEAQQRQISEERRNVEQQRRRVEEEEARLVEELNHATRLEYPRAVMYQNTELAQAQLQKIEQLKERHSALQHYKRALDEKLLDEKLQKTAGLQAAAAGASGVIVRGATEERATALGVVSKGAMKEFPPSMAKSAIGIAGPPSSFSAHGLIGISRSPNESTMAARRLVAHGQATSQQQQLQQQESVSHANAAEVGAARSHARADSMINAGIVRKTCDPLMFDLNQSAQSLFRAHYHNVIDDELSGNDAPSSAEVKRKSGIHTVYLPSVPGGHHTPSMKMSSSATAGHRRTTTSPALSMQRAGALPSTHAAAPSPLGVTTPQQQQTASASARSSPSAAQFAHVLPASMQHPQPQSHHSPSHPPIASTIPLQPASLSMRAGTGSPAGAAFPSRTPAATPSLMSPRTPLTINPGLASPISSTHPSPQTPATAPPAAFRASTPSSSPFQMSPSLGSLSPNVGASPRGSLSNLTFHAAAFTHPAGISTVSSSVLASNTQPTTAPSEAPNKSQLPSVKPSEPSAEEPSSASAETRPEPFMVSANFEPLSPDNGDSPPMSDFNSTSQSGTPDQSCMPLFSLLNLPENGSVNSTPVRPVLSTADLHDSMNDEQDTVTSSIVTTVTSARPPPPTYEPLSDDE